MYIEKSLNAMFPCMQLDLEVTENGSEKLICFCTLITRCCFGQCVGISSSYEPVVWYLVNIFITRLRFAETKMDAYIVEEVLPENRR